MDIYIAILILVAIVFWIIGGVMGVTIVESRCEKAAKANRCISLDGRAYRLTEVTPSDDVG